MRQHRLIYDLPTEGRHNMAVDEAILSAVIVGDSLPTLRLYAWEPPCLSLGYAQPWTDVDTDRLTGLGWGLVRRATGGRAILHTDELTYSLALPEDHPLAEGSIVESYRRISRALLAAMKRLGLHPQADRRADRHPTSGPVCFETPSHYEITTGDQRKLVGSAQVRRKGGILQHGSLPLWGDVARICDALAFPDEDARQAAREKVRRRAATLADALGGHVITWDEAARAVAAGFAEVFDLELIPGQHSAAEQAHADHLAQTVYGSESWTRRA
jgi:lipoyl(octanoyl) transferase